jgi:DUF4097 and DUF4098 domain-containing protein YvlB
VPTFETPGRVGLRLDVPSGDVTIHTWDEPRVDVEVTASRNDEVSREAAAETRVEASDRGRGPELDVVIRCPEGADLELSTHSADLEARGPLGVVGIRSASGDVIVLDTKSLNTTTASGDLTAGSVGGALVAKSASGDVDVKSVSGEATASTVSGDLRIGRVEGAATLSTVSGDVDLELAEASVRINSVSGDVAVAMQPGLLLWLDVQSVSGSVASELEVGDAPVDGGEQVELRVRTVSGDVRVATAPGVSARNEA